MVFITWISNSQQKLFYFIKNFKYQKINQRQNKQIHYQFDSAIRWQYIDIITRHF